MKTKDNSPQNLLSMAYTSAHGFSDPRCLLVARRSVKLAYRQSYLLSIIRELISGMSGGLRQAYSTGRTTSRRTFRYIS